MRDFQPDVDWINDDSKASSQRQLGLCEFKLRLRKVGEIVERMGPKRRECC